MFNLFCLLIFIVQINFSSCFFADLLKNLDQCKFCKKRQYSLKSGEKFVCSDPSAKLRIVRLNFEQLLKKKLILPAKNADDTWYKVSFLPDLPFYWTYSKKELEDSLTQVVFDEYDAPVAIISSYERGAMGVISFMAVVEQWQKKKIGSGLVERVIEQCKKAGLQEIALESFDSRSDALYSKFGFLPDKTVYNYCYSKKHLKKSDKNTSKKCDWRSLHRDTVGGRLFMTKSLS